MKLAVQAGADGVLVISARERSQRRNKERRNHD